MTVAAPAGGSASPSLLRRRLLLGLPVLGVAGVVGLMVRQLRQAPGTVASPLIGKPVPAFSLPPVAGRTLGFSSADLGGRASLVNVFASWCVPCREEHPFLMELARERSIAVLGINYKDAARDAEAWLNANGDPYARTGADLDGRVSFDWGVYGVPETYLVDADGRIAYKVIGPLSAETYRRTIEPVLGTLSALPQEAR